ncbi:cytochrome c maturation protein CcmE [Magnetospirillum gryphiswaldense]|jgi:cytochrome c-type biogenesis protein CcmE|uniref:Cytochrome c-type biogenesis protein CcmE n=2 Tax=Magnetospirillum gryphiswaldense TaxID=55518 RepID=A4GL48_MAGGM|nr:cytochrome c maturation protein CcmE [Magnetospirillum gryphiswaldense]ABO28735.1 cytochrome c-type biogenesis protein [Magnetospirillum gryphiswaldense MSR-1]AVM75382.1 Cytochrome c-type biogenesis protein CcmE [Magnetospirillum gryphiswaldense MSR-1]AVM79285.1 Cytochrome c-type biogenesis protein CcmE [Magnetospirillum gryphiswaldense]CAM77637.1 cytochrome c-type biogenesis protein [Magnetospirillum gryphiswaldense MSR-1]CDL00403.1 periplasmic heme chaperone [Magnetospirillum gryphiswalde
MTRKKRRLYFVILGLLAVGTAAALVLSALRQDIVFFFSPTEILEAKVQTEGRRIRLGGLVEQGSVVKDGAKVRFKVTDGAHSLPVEFEGLLPDLFREGQGVVTEGRMGTGVFLASEVLAKHDENYMPKEVADSLKKSGHWQGEEKK